MKWLFRVYYAQCAKSFLHGSDYKELKKGIYLANIPNDLGGYCIVVNPSRITAAGEEWLHKEGNGNG